MRNRGLRRPGLNAAICVALAVGGALSVWWGASEMNALGHETGATAAAIAFGLLAGIPGFLFFFQFVWGARVIGAMRRGDGVIARWTVAPATFDVFRTLDQRLAGTAEENDYKLPRETPPDGVQIVFSADGVLLGDTFFGLATTGLGRFDAVRLRQSPPLCLEFGTAFITAVTQMRLRQIHGVLRVPIAHDAQTGAAKVLAHYQDVIARRTIVKPNFWRTRIKIGLSGAAVCGVTAAIGLSLREMNEALANVPLIMAVAGTVFALGGLVLALIAFVLLKRQHEA